MKGHVFIVEAMLQYCENPEQIITSPAVYGQITRRESTVLNIAATKYDDPSNRKGNIDFTPRYFGALVVIKHKMKRSTKCLEITKDFAWS